MLFAQFGLCELRASQNKCDIKIPKNSLLVGLPCLQNKFRSLTKFFIQQQKQTLNYQKFTYFAKSYKK